MRIYAIGYFEGDTYKVKRVKANTVAEAHEKANLDTPIVRIQREEYKDINMAIEALKAEPQSISFENDTEIKSYSKDSDLISRADAIEAIELVDWYHQNSNKDMIHGANDDEHQAWYKAQDIYKALDAIPSADRPRGEQYKKGFEDAKRAFLVEYARESENMRKRNAQLEVRLNAQKAISADRPRGEWIEMGENKDGTHNIRCDQCGESFKARGHANSHNTKKKYRFCPSCGADMRGDQNE